MQYKAEIMVDKSIAASLMGQATHPNQAVRKVLDKIENTQNKPEYMNIYVLNERGEAWVYAVKRKNGDYAAMMTHKSSRLLPSNITHSIFSGNKRIAEVF